jgi:hypothetical protein
VTRGNISELAATTFVALLIALLSVETIGYRGEQRSGGEGVSQSPLMYKLFSSHWVETYGPSYSPFGVRHGRVVMMPIESPSHGHSHGRSHGAKSSRK